MDWLDRLKQRMEDQDIAEAVQELNRLGNALRLEKHHRAARVKRIRSKSRETITKLKARLYDLEHKEG
jgi:hypothetical protein